MLAKDYRRQTLIHELSSCNADLVFNGYELFVFLDFFQQSLGVIASDERHAFVHL
jgi:hypothetical protein